MSRRVLAVLLITCLALAALAAARPDLGLTGWLLGPFLLLASATIVAAIRGAR